MRKVCVTGGSGYIGSSLVKKLLDKGYIVHATLRNLEDESKVGLLKSLPNAETNLVLFQADIYNNNDFEAAIQGCQFVFHVAIPWENGPPNSQYKDKVEATVKGAKAIVEACIRSRTVKRLIYTASVLAASPLNEDGKSFKSCIDESCWTPLHLPFSHGNDCVLDYLKSKTIAEHEILRYNEVENAKLEVVTLACGLVGGDSALLSSVPLSVSSMSSQITGFLFGYNHGLMFMQQVLGSIPIVHIDDVCEAHVFCIENHEIKGRFLCAVANPSSLEIASYFIQEYPELKIAKEFIGEAGEKITFDSSKLIKMGFVYKYDMKKILDGNVKCERRLGALSQLSVN
ncbi:NADPH HC-toxin reductase 1-like [Euphorbia lathyris]|uniref:NADPH HC-toxin reductase 1-like n=1 Tax=Euphorbia lathyris TaxID=212925 RepID=UPI0033134F71